MSAQFHVGINDKYPVILAQLAPPAGGELELYKVPHNTHCWIDRAIFANVSNNPRTFCLALCPGGVANHPHDWIVFDHASAANEEYDRDLSVRLNPGDSVRILTDNGNVTFQLFGMLL